MATRDTGIGCGYAGRGDMKHAGGESACYRGRIRRVAVTASGKLWELTRICPQCLGAWRRYRQSAV